MNEEDSEGGKFSCESIKADENSTGSEDEQDILCMTLAQAKRSKHDREMHTDSSSGTYSLGAPGDSSMKRLEEKNLR